MSDWTAWTEEELVVYADPDLEDLIPIFLENRNEDVTALQEALSQGDFERVRVLAHNMRGAGGGYGFEAITQIGKRMEEAAKAQDGSTITSGIVALEAYLGKVQVIYE